MTELLHTLLPALLFTTGAVGVVARRTPDVASRRVVMAATAGLAFQGFHALEHLLQLAHWLVWPGEGAWLTPWAATGRDAIGAVVGTPALATEVLHLVGNVVFLGGAVAAGAAVRHHRRVGPRLAQGLALQAVHVVEHLALTATLLVAGRAVGVTNLLGLVPAGARATGVRVVLHAVVNTVATALVVVGLVHHATRRDEDGVVRPADVG